jgi:hypothetical protein
MTSTDMSIPEPSAALKRVDGADGTSIDDRWKYARAIAGAEDVIPASLWGNRQNADGTTSRAPSPAKIMVVQEIARMLGFHPLAGITSVHIIEGRPSLSAAIMSAKIRSVGHTLRVGTRGSIETGDLVGFARLIRKDDPDYTYEVEWSLGDAQRAGLGTLSQTGRGYAWASSKNNWQKYPRAMLKARAIAEVCREAAEEALMGAAYIPDELGAETNEVGELTAAPARAPERDWAAAIAEATTLVDILAIGKALGGSPDYTVELWGRYSARLGIIAAAAEAAADEEPIDGEAEEPTGPEEPRDRVDESEVVDAEVVHEGPTAAADSASGVDDPDWTGDPCPACGGKHDPSVHDSAEDVDA